MPNKLTDVKTWQLIQCQLQKLNAEVRGRRADADLINELDAWWVRLVEKLVKLGGSPELKEVFIDFILIPSSRAVKMVVRPTTDRATKWVEKLIANGGTELDERTKALLEEGDIQRAALLSGARA